MANEDVAIYKKRIVESFKTSRFIILIAIFGFFALVSPATAKYVNEIIKLVGEGIEIQFPEPTYIDSFVQIFKNLNSICLIALIISFSSIISKEKSKNTIYLVLSKGLSRKEFYISKLLGALLIYTVVYVTTSVVSIYYTVIIFGTFDFSGVALSFLMFWLYGFFMISVTLFFSNISKSTTSSTVFSVLIYFVFSILTAFKKLNEYLPSRLSTLPLEIITNKSLSVDAYPAIAITAILIIIINIAGTQILMHQEL